MIVTEEEAKTKRCQESFGDRNVSSAGYAYPGGPYAGQAGATVAIHTSPTMCIGSNCMAWRWHTDIHGRAGGGYCGKAGVP